MGSLMMHRMVLSLMSVFVAHTAVAQTLTCDYGVRAFRDVDDSAVLARLADPTAALDYQLYEDSPADWQPELDLAFAAVNALGWDVAPGDLDALFDVPDDREFIIRKTVRPDYLSVGFTWVQFYVGDTEVGAIFDDFQNPGRVTHTISDGSIVGPNLLDIESTEKIELLSETVAALDYQLYEDSNEDWQEAVDQAFIAVQTLGFDVRTGDFDALFAIPDGGTFTLRRSISEFPGAGFDWIQFYVGDTETGAFFAESYGVKTLTGTVQDGDILGCR